MKMFSLRALHHRDSRGTPVLMDWYHETRSADIRAGDGGLLRNSANIAALLRQPCE
jgi:hypothetical protein